jgi:hypothetical protein
MASQVTISSQAPRAPLAVCPVVSGCQTDTVVPTLVAIHKAATGNASLRSAPSLPRSHHSAPARAMSEGRWKSTVAEDARVTGSIRWLDRPSIGRYTHESQGWNASGGFR